jgi:hydroxymethylbilane synthase
MQASPRLERLARKRRIALPPGETPLQERLVRIGTRGSALALAQANEVRSRLMAAHGWPETSFEIVIIKTTGDMILDRPLAEVGGKGLFTKEIEEALLDKRIDLAVHSMKDMQTVLPDGLTIGATLPREDVRDAFISLKHKSFEELPEGAVVGTSSLRRQAQIKRIRPDLKIVGFRGNVQTRLTKLRDEIAEATFLACAGLKRLGLGDHITSAIPTESMLPAVAQGAIGLEIRIDDEETAEMIAPLDDQTTALCVTAERAFLAKLEGSCRTPIAGLARLDGQTLAFKGETLSPDGRLQVISSQSGPASSAANLGVTAAEDILSRGGREVLQG